MLKILALIPKAPKHIVFKALADMNIRRKWDTALKDAIMIDEDPANEQYVFHYIIPTPAIIQTRDALMLKKVARDYPKKD